MCIANTLTQYGLCVRSHVCALRMFVHDRMSEEDLAADGGSKFEDLGD
jgi:hypothetical protein